MRWVQVVAIGLALAGCTANNSGGRGEMTWMRTDGRPVDGGFRAAADQCRDVASRVGTGTPRREREETMMAAMQSCMQQRGYVWRCQHPLGELAQGACEEDEALPSNRGKPPRSAAPPGRSMT
jgi:hypothetical protein